MLDTRVLFSASDKAHRWDKERSSELSFKSSSSSFSSWIWLDMPARESWTNNISFSSIPISQLLQIQSINSLLANWPVCSNATRNSIFWLTARTARFLQVHRLWLNLNFENLFETKSFRLAHWIQHFVGKVCDNYISKWWIQICISWNYHCIHTCWLNTALLRWVPLQPIQIYIANHLCLDKYIDARKSPAMQVLWHFSFLCHMWRPRKYYTFFPVLPSFFLVLWV